MLASTFRSTILPASARLALRPAGLVTPTHTALTLARRGMSNAAKQRPLSPHLAIYKFPFNAVTSVAFRATGILLTVGAYAAIDTRSLLGAAPSLMPFPSPLQVLPACPSPSSVPASPWSTT